MSQPRVIVISHEHDETEGVYRMLVGLPVYDTRPVLSEDPDEQGTERVVIGYSETLEVVFANDDERWAGKSAEDVENVQRRIVAKALRDRLAQSA